MSFPPDRLRPALRPSRRAVLGAGLAAALWRAAPVRAAAPSVAPDGFLPLEAARSRLAFLPPPADPADTLAWSGSVPGPLLRVKKGEELKLRISNRLAGPTTLCLPGLRTANAVAGYGGLTGPRLGAGASADIRFTPPDAGFNLYLPHAGATDAGQQGRGLFGPIIVDEAEAPDVDEDVVVVLSDWTPDDKGQIRDDFSDPALSRGAGRRGSVVFAGAAAAPLALHARPGARVRLRLGNAATARLTAIGVDGAKTLIVAVDGQPAEPFEPLRNQFPMGPGARFELMFDMPREAGASVRFVLRQEGGAPDAPFVAVTGVGDPVAPRPSPGRLTQNPALPVEIALEAARSFEVAVTGGGASPFAVNGVTFADWGPKPLAVLRRGAPTVFAFANRTASVQAMRLGGHVARLLHSMDDGWEPYWRDTLLIQPGRTLHAAFVADNPGKWPVESAIPEHRAAGVGAWFEVG